MSIAERVILIGTSDILLRLMVMPGELVPKNTSGRWGPLARLSTTNTLSLSLSPNRVFVVEWHASTINVLGVRRDHNVLVERNAIRRFILAL